MRFLYNVPSRFAEQAVALAAGLGFDVRTAKPLHPHGNGEPQRGLYSREPASRDHAPLTDMLQRRLLPLYGAEYDYEHGRPMVTFAGTPFGPLTLRQTLSYFDKPLISLAEDDKGGVFLVQKGDESDEGTNNIYLVVAITPAMAAALRSHQDEAERGALYTVIYGDGSCGWIVERARPSDADPSGRTVYCRPATVRDLADYRPSTDLRPGLSNQAIPSSP